MAFGSSTISDFGGAVSDILGGKATAEGLRLKAKGDLAEAEDYGLASSLANENADYTRISTAIKLTQQDREAFLGIGATTADIAGSGFNTGSGSALDILRSGASQAALTHQVVGAQGQITEAGYKEQGATYANMQAAAEQAAADENNMADTSSRNGWITGAIKGAAGIASLFL